jgi:hypothetical protein
VEELNEQDHNLIDRLTSGRATAEDLHALALRESDPLFTEHLAFVQSMSRVAGHREEQFLRKEFSNVDAHARQPGRKSPFKYLLWVGVTLLVVALAYFIYTQFRVVQSSPQQYYAEFYTPMPNLVAPIEQGSSRVNEYQEAFRSYERREYEIAVRQFEQLEVQDDATRFYYALALLADDQTTQAIPILREIRDATSSEYTPAAHWYLILSYLNVGDMANVRSEINTLLQDDQHRYRRNALALQEKMN